MQNCREYVHGEKESHKQLLELQSSILGAIPHAVVGLKNRTIIFANDAFESVFGWKADEIIGKKTRVLYRSDQDFVDIGERFYSLLRRQKTHIEDFPCVRKDGQEILCRMSASVIGKELVDKQIVIMYQNITRLRKIESDLHKSEQKYRTVFENTGTAMIIFDEDATISLANAEIEKMTGYSREEIEGRMGWTEFVLDEDVEKVRNWYLLRSKDPEKAPKSHELRMITKRGEIKVISMTLATIGGTRKSIASIIDISDRKKAEEELNRYHEHLEDLVRERTRQLEILNSELEVSNAKLQEFDKLKSMFIASMSHELRTPLNSIIGFTGMTLQGLSGELNDEQKDNLARSYQSAKHLLSLITDVIDISKIEAGRIDAFTEEIHLKAVISEAISNVRPLVKDKKLEIAEQGHADVHLHTDRRRLLQCLLNFLSNAVKYTESGVVTIATAEANGQVEISVSDTGIGIAEKDLPKLFEAFERLDTHLRVKAGGTGLGLYLTKKIATDLLHGEVAVRSKEGQGSTFTLRLPKVAPTQKPSDDNECRGGIG
jgi:PAS domain S-box-containing protein